MIEALVLIAFMWLFWKALKLAFKVSWNLAKIVAVALFVLSLPTLFGVLLVTGGLTLLLPIALIGTAWGILKACV